jgi:hypothetical protein
MSSGWYTNGYCRRRGSASELLKRVVMLLAHLGAPAPERADAPPKRQLHALFHHHSDGRPVPIVGIGWVCRKDSYPEILAGSRRVPRDRRHSRPVSPFSSGLNSSRRVSIILSLVLRSRVHHWVIASVRSALFGFSVQVSSALRMCSQNEYSRRLQRCRKSVGEDFEDNIIADLVHIFS